MVNCQLRNDLRGVPEKWACSKAEGGGGGGLTWPLILRIFGMVSITFFFAPPPPPLARYVKLCLSMIRLNMHSATFDR